MQNEKDDILKKLKIREVKTYGSSEWMAGKQKKYRRVFDRTELAYVYVEFSFYNKLFDESDWDINVELRAYALKGARRTQLCSLPIEKTVNKTDNIVYIRDGWGNKKQGLYWKKGVYIWEIVINNEVIASTHFYVEDIGIVTPEINPYFNIEAMKLYESGDAGVPKEERIFYKKFDNKESRFIFIEFTIKNLVHPEPWTCELKFNFYNDARQLKGATVELKSLGSDDQYYTITTGWGSDAKGTWFPDNYTLEVVFMDQLIAILPFEVGEGFEEGMNEAYLPNRVGETIVNPAIEPDLTLEEVMQKLDNLIGLKEIKTKVKEYSEYLQFIQLRKDKGFDEPGKPKMHAIFTGNPGTGKTTVAKMLGKIYQKMGLLTKGHVHEVDRSDLVGEYIGQTAPKVKETLKKAKGGILFIDEAYALSRSKEDNKDFGREVIEILVKEMSDGKGDIAMIFAGYPAEMKTFLDSNAGLKSRINLKFEFSDYLPQELIEIAEFACNEKAVKLTTQSKAFLYDKLVEAYRKRDKFFGNARSVYTLIEKGKMNLGLRVMQTETPELLTDAELSEIRVEDFERIYKENIKELPDIPVNDDELQLALNELDQLVGLEKAKKDIHDLVKLVTYYKESNFDVLNSFSLHTVFTGNPGTGKTTVARIIARIYKALGILERGHLVECDRQSLVAGFVGQTALKTTQKINEAEGGILFIDEAYALAQSSRNDFGNEAVETLLKRMEDQKNQFAVIVAGYPEEMKNFIESNPGLKSRFDRTIHFEDLALDEMLTVAKMQLKAKGYDLTESAATHFRSYLKALIFGKDKYFGNGRTVRNTVDEIIRAQNLRIADLPPSKRSSKKMKSIILQDVQFLDDSKAREISGKGKIGFRGGM